MSNDVSAVDSVPFEDVCVMLEKLYNKKHRKLEQNDILINFIQDVKNKLSRIKDKKDASLFPLMRLLAPNLERERNAYNMKEAKLAQVLIDTIPLSKQSQDGRRLLKWRSVNSSKDLDFAGAAYYVLKNKARKSSNLGIGDINNILDKIAANNMDNRKQVLHDTFTYALKNLSAEQFKWFIRIILKDLNCSMKNDRVLSALHPDAPKLYTLRGNLSEVCEEFDDGNDFTEFGVKVFSAVKPMLSEQLDVTDVLQLAPNKTYQVEEKFDGERFQMHMENGVYEYFSRKRYPFSKNYGDTYEKGLLTPYLKDCIKTDVTSFILDGEMMGWDKRDQCFGSKGMEYDIKKVTEKSVFRPCFCAFDILYYNGQALIGSQEEGGMPLKHRLELLDTLFTDKAGVIQHSKREIVKQSSDILDALNKAMENQEEGIVVKDIESYYFPNQRNAGWYKIKPEYTEGAMNELDLVIIGADEGNNKRHGRARCFLVACLDKPESGDKNRRWLCVGRVITGLTKDERERISAALQLHWVRAEDKPPPLDLVFNKSKPDFWVAPEYSIVLQIRASELIRSSVYGTSHTLRFPRVERVRDDKPVDDVMTLDEFNRLLENKGTVVKLTKERIDEQDITQGQVTKMPRKRTLKPPPQIAEQFKLVKHDNVDVISKALLGRKVCILSDDDDCSRADLSKIVMSHSGTVVASSGSETWCCVVGRMNYQAKVAIELQRDDITTTSWLRSLPASDGLCSLRPLDMLAIKRTTKLHFAKNFDTFGDSFTVPSDEETLKKCFDRMDDDDMHLTTREMLDLDAELFKGVNPYSFLRSCCIYFVQCEELTVILAKMYGAAVYGEGMFNLTHVVISNKAQPEEINEVKQKYNGVLFTSESWLKTCFSQETFVSEGNFVI